MRSGFEAGVQNIDDGIGFDVSVIFGEIAEQYYCLALSAAARGDLNGAVVYARYALMADANHQKALKLLHLCLYELGWLSEKDASGGASESVDINEEYTEAFEKIRSLAGRQKWMDAARIARSIPRQSVCVLNILGCIYACAKRYGEAARYFADALEKDCGNQLALAGLADTVKRRKQVLGTLRNRFLGGITL